MKEIIYLSGLPRSGSTLLCNLLDKHPEISSTPSSPLCGMINNLRRIWSDDPFLLAQLDSDFDVVYSRMMRSLKAFMQEWSSDTNTPITIEKNRGWCTCVSLLNHLFPNFKMIICLRDLRDVFSSVEKRHKETLLLDFPDHMEHHLVDNRASALFDDNGIIGGPLKALYNLGDTPDIMRHMYFWKFEDFLEDPTKSMNAIFNWIGVSNQEIDFEKNIEQTTTQEADSYYRFKYMHKIKPKFEQPDNLEERKISPRIINSIMERFKWYYETYYPETSDTPAPKEIDNEIEDEIAKSIEESTEKATEEVKEDCECEGDLCSGLGQKEKTEKDT